MLITASYNHATGEDQTLQHKSRVHYGLLSARCTDGTLKQD